MSDIVSGSVSDVNYFKRFLKIHLFFWNIADNAINERLLYKNRCYIQKIVLMPLATLKLSCFFLKGLTIKAFSKIFGHAVHFCST